MKIEDYKVGNNADNGIITKIYCSTTNFVLYEVDKSGNVASASTDKIDASCTNILKPLLIEIDSFLTTKNERRKYSSKKAMAIADCFYGHSESGKEILEKLLKAISRYKNLKSRIFYMVSAILFVIFNIIIALLINTVFKESIDKYVILLFTIATFGSMGGLISVLTKIPSLKLDIDGGTFLQVIDGFSRIFLSMISSVIILLFIKADILLGTLNQIENDKLFYAFSIIAGFSEKYIPDIIQSIKKDNN